MSPSDDGRPLSPATPSLGRPERERLRPPRDPRRRFLRAASPVGRDPAAAPFESADPFESAGEFDSFEELVASVDRAGSTGGFGRASLLESFEPSFE